MRIFRQRAIRTALIVVAAASLFVFGTGRTTARSADKPITIYLGFDDGPAPSLTDSILDTLKKYNVKATFFIELSLLLCSIPPGEQLTSIDCRTQPTHL